MDEKGLRINQLSLDEAEMAVCYNRYINFEREIVYG